MTTTARIILDLYVFGSRRLHYPQLVFLAVVQLFWHIWRPIKTKYHVNWQPNWCYHKQLQDNGVLFTLGCLGNIRWWCHDSCHGPWPKWRERERERDIQTMLWPDRHWLFRFCELVLILRQRLFVPFLVVRRRIYRLLQSEVLWRPYAYRGVLCLRGWVSLRVCVVVVFVSCAFLFSFKRPGLISQLSCVYLRTNNSMD